MLRPTDVTCPYCCLTLMCEDDVGAWPGFACGDAGRVCGHVVLITANMTRLGALGVTGRLTRGPLAGETWLPEPVPTAWPVLMAWCELAAERVPCAAATYTGDAFGEHGLAGSFWGVAVFALEPVDFGEAIRDMLPAVGLG